MTEITRVPLQPIKKGSLTKLWVGVLLAVLVAAQASAVSAIDFYDGIADRTVMAPPEQAPQQASSAATTEVLGSRQRLVKPRQL